MFLIETNIRQRGIIDGSGVKQGRRYIELERIYGIKNGRPQKLPSNSEVNLTQPQLASMTGISVDTLNKFKKLTLLIPEIEDLVDTGIVTPTTALSIVR